MKHTRIATFFWTQHFVRRRVCIRLSSNAGISVLRTATNKRYNKHNRRTSTAYITSAIFNEEGPSTVKPNTIPQPSLSSYFPSPAWGVFSSPPEAHQQVQSGAHSADKPTGID